MDQLSEWFQRTTDLSCTHAFDGRILSVNPSMCRALGYSENQLLRMNIGDLLTPENRSTFPIYLATVRQQGSASGRMIIRTATGDRRVWKYDNVLVAGVVMGVGRDTTDEDEQQRAVISSEQHYRMLVENNPDVLMILDRDGHIRYHNEAAVRGLQLQYGPAGILGCALGRLVHHDDRDGFETAIARLAVEGNCVERLDARLRRHDGEFRSFEIIFSRLMRRGRVKRIIVNARDVTERKLLEQQLEQANRLSSLGRLAATVAHEFNNVLMGMLPFAELLRKEGIGQDLIDTSTRHLIASIKRGKRVSQDVLRFTQPAEPTLAPMALDQWWNRFLPEVVAIFGDRIGVESNVQPVTVAADPMQLTQLFSNLVSNARDAMPSGGILSVSTRTPHAHEEFSFGVVANPERFIQITVRDTGQGIPVELQRHVFDPLFTTKRNGGTGLGLAVAHHVATRHGGHIFLESEVGVGTTFHVFLLKVSPAEVKELPPIVVMPRPSLRRVLVVDDEPLIVDGVVALLELEGFEVRVATSGAEALREVEREVPDLIVLDIGLPDMDGLVVGRRIRASHPTLPILFATGHGDSQAIPRDEHTTLLRKPFHFEELLTRIVGLDQREDV
ncbi:MAG TPA: PAS domain S-box protein [Thermoanaerobaculia bacterium]|jgi:PAS domain S-box-containing protein|nr:PAS domain S-box protein [Thermoanaerobaculia bacterium]